MNNKKRNPAFSPFHGTVDQLLANMELVDDNQVERILLEGVEDYILSDEEAVSMIMAEANVQRDEAVDILNEIKSEEMQRVLTKLVGEGIVEVTSYDDAGEPLYGLTANGKALATSFGSKKK
jgi:hypothetical protein